MEWQKNGAIRLTRDQVNSLSTQMSLQDVDTVELSEGNDGRLLVKKVETVERLSALKLTKTK